MKPMLRFLFVIGSLEAVDHRAKRKLKEREERAVCLPARRIDTVTSIHAWVVLCATTTLFAFDWILLHNRRAEPPFIDKVSRYPDGESSHSCIVARV
jgi:hypothetical protein